MQPLWFAAEARIKIFKRRGTGGEVQNKIDRQQDYSSDGSIRSMRNVLPEGRDSKNQRHTVPHTK